METTKTQKQKFITLLVMMLISGTMYKVYFLMDAFYVQMQDFMGLSHTQIGFIYSVAGWISQFGFLAATYISDKFSKRKMIAFALIANGITGGIISTYPQFSVLVVLFCMCAIFTDMLCWPTVLKTIRLLGTKEEQGRMFGFLETGRGLTDTIVNFSALAIFVAMGSNAFGFRCSIIFFSAISITAGILAYITVEDDKKEKSSETEDKKEKSSIKDIFTDKGVWLVSINIFMIYCLYSGLKYLVPFLREAYSIPAALASAYGIINMYGLKMVGGPIGGIISDKVTHSATKFIRIMFVISAVSLGAYTLLPHGSMSVYVTMIISLVISAFVFCMRAIFFAPMDEINVSKQLTGAAMSLGSFIGYLPGAFIAIIYGRILDTNPGISGYMKVFMIMATIAVVGFFISCFLIKEIKKRQTAEEIK